MTSPFLTIESQSPDLCAGVWKAEHVLRIGRLPDLEVPLEHHSVSRLHAELAFDGLGWVIRDLGSTNGTFLNGVRVGRSDHKVGAGDLIQAGWILLRVRDLAGGGDAGSPAPEDRQAVKGIAT